MWLVDVNSSGDLISDEYLHVFAPNDSYSDDFGYRPRFLDDFDLQNRVETLQSVLERVTEELEWLQQHGASLIGISSYADVDFEGGDVSS